MNLHSEPVSVSNPLERQIAQLAEAAELLEASRPDLAEACWETAQTLREETELALWLDTPDPLPTPC
ncbi:MAG: hypothetical protein U5L06_14665 [Rhodovibrio sp.]|nr:hypothetical protein [Rhodovibrio sp.]